MESEPLPRLVLERVLADEQLERLKHGPVSCYNTLPTWWVSNVWYTLTGPVTTATC